MKLFSKILGASFVMLLGLGSFNVIPAAAQITEDSSSVEAPVITSISIKPGTPAKIANSLLFHKKGQVIEFNLLDQYGKPVSYGNYSGTVTISGPAIFEDFRQTSELKVKNGQGKLTIYITNYFRLGEIIITPHFHTLLNKSFTETLYVPKYSGNATQVVLSSTPSTTVFSIDTLRSNGTKPFLTYDLEAEDNQGIHTATNAPTGMTAEVTYNGNPSSAVVATLSSIENGKYSVSLNLSENAIESSSEISRGTYTVNIIPDVASKTIFPPLTETFTIMSE
ncbi:hypothetical protein ACHOLT_05815 [Desulfitobacterium sp. Sab5]|uniref:hypothetical protein n=1 Tax=Desulfitobacterium nosdiversum TaxID=3375356 RepID=UPI003CEF1AB5